MTIVAADRPSVAVSKVASGEGRAPLELFAAAVALVLPVAFVTSLDAPAWSLRAAVLLVVAAVGLPVLVSQTRGPRPLAARAAVAFLAAGTASAVLSHNHTTAVFGLYNQGTGLLFMASLAGAWAIGRRMRPTARPLLERALLIGIFVNVFVVLLSSVVNLTSISPDLVDSSGRPSGLAGNSVHLAALAVLGLALLVPRLVAAPAAWAVPVAAVAAATQLSGTRGALIVMAGIAGWAGRRHGLRVAAMLAVLLVLGVAVGSAIGTSATATGRAGQFSSLSDRPATWLSAWPSVVEHPLLGVGPGQFRTATAPHHPVSVARSAGSEQLFSDAHDIFLEYGTTTGLLGLGALVVWLVAATRSAPGMASRRRPGHPGHPPVRAPIGRDDPARVLGARCQRVDGADPAGGWPTTEPLGAPCLPRRRGGRGRLAVPLWRARGTPGPARPDDRPGPAGGSASPAVAEGGIAAGASVAVPGHHPRPGSGRLPDQSGLAASSGPAGQRRSGVVERPGGAGREPWPARGSAGRVRRGPAAQSDFGAGHEWAGPLGPGPLRPRGSRLLAATGQPNRASCPEPGARGGRTRRDRRADMRRLARLLLYGGTAALVLGLSDFHATYIGHYPALASGRLTWALAYIAVLCLVAYAVGLPDLPRNAYQAMGLALAANLAAALCISIIQLVLGMAILPRFVVFWTATLLVPGYALCAFVAARGRRDQRRRDRVLAVLTAEEAAALEADMSRAERRASLARVLSHNEATATETGLRPLLEAFAEVDASILVLDRLAQGIESVVTQAARLHGRGVRIRTLSLFYDEWLGKLPLSELERVALMFDIGELHRLRYGRVKHLVDGLVALLGLALLVVLLPFVLVANAIGNRGPLLFRQRRVGKGGKEFTILKFRTMRPDGDDGEWTADNDTRITPVGRWLRRTHLDELPQVVNILRGEVAIVGPRPEQPQHVRTLTEKIPFYELRHLIRPGLTGWAQLNYHYGGNELDALQKLQYEFYYLRHQSLALDVRIIVRTLREVVGRGGR